MTTLAMTVSMAMTTVTPTIMGTKFRSDFDTAITVV
jgi:hypothetical protein